MTAAETIKRLEAFLGECTEAFDESNALHIHDEQILSTLEAALAALREAESLRASAATELPSNLEAESPSVLRQSEARPNAGQQSGRRVAESQAPVPSEPGEDGVAPIVAPALPHQSEREKAAREAAEDLAELDRVAC